MATALASLVFMHALFSRSPVVVAVQAAAVALSVWARLALGRRSFHPAADVAGGDLVTTGPYRFIRHPIYTAACVFCWAGVLANFALMPFAAGVLLLIGAAIRVFAEERLLERDRRAVYLLKGNRPRRNWISSQPPSMPPR
jgi:protein-S-isoprenylcysteine O-methyltransferase